MKAIAGLTALMLNLAGCAPPPGGPQLALEHDTVVHYQHSMRTPEALAQGRFSAGDIESLYIAHLAADGRQRVEQLLVSQGGGSVPDGRRGRWTTTVYEPSAQGLIAHALDYDRRGAWSEPTEDALRMPAGATRGKDDEVLGQACTLWHYADAEQEIEGCYNPQGVALRYVLRMQPAVIRFEAKSFTVADIDPTLLVVPPGWSHFEGGGRAPVPTMNEVLAPAPNDVFLDCRGDAVCKTAQAKFAAAWTAAQAGEQQALLQVSRCLTQNCEGAVRIYPALGCVFASLLERRHGIKRPDTCYRDTSVPEQSFVIDATRELERRIAGE